MVVRKNPLRVNTILLPDTFGERTSADINLTNETKTNLCNYRENLISL